jgi:hypothetical protein
MSLSEDQIVELREVRLRALARVAAVRHCPRVACWSMAISTRACWARAGSTWPVYERCVAPQIFDEFKDSEGIPYERLDKVLLSLDVTLVRIRACRRRWRPLPHSRPARPPAPRPAPLRTDQGGPRRRHGAERGQREDEGRRVRGPAAPRRGAHGLLARAGRLTGPCSSALCSSWCSCPLALGSVSPTRSQLQEPASHDEVLEALRAFADKSRKINVLELKHILSRQVHRRALTAARSLA